jgi:hypothetical protein
MRRLHLIILLSASSVVAGCVNTATPKTYYGVVKRGSTGRPLPAVPVEVRWRVPYFSFFRADEILGKAVTQSEGRFAFTTNRRGKRLSFDAWGQAMEQRVDPAVSSGLAAEDAQPRSGGKFWVIRLGVVSISNPSPNRLNVIAVPDDFVPWSANMPVRRIAPANGREIPVRPRNNKRSRHGL